MYKLEGKNESGQDSVIEAPNLPTLINIAAQKGVCGNIYCNDVLIDKIVPLPTPKSDTESRLKRIEQKLLELETLFNTRIKRLEERTKNND